MLSENVRLDQSATQCQNGKVQIYEQALSCRPLSSLQIGQLSGNWHSSVNSWTSKRSFLFYSTSSRRRLKNGAMVLKEIDHGIVLRDNLGSLISLPLAKCSGIQLLRHHGRHSLAAVDWPCTSLERCSAPQRSSIIAGNSNSVFECSCALSLWFAYFALRITQAIG